MEKSVEPAPAPTKEDKPHFFNRILKVISFPIAAISGFWGANKEIQAAVFGKAKSVEGDPLFGDIKRKYAPQYTENAEKLKGGLSKREFLANDFSIKAAHSSAVGDQLERMGLGNKWFGLKDLPAKWRYINRGSKQNAIVQGMTVAGIAIGALLTIANSRSLIDFFSRNEEKDEKTR